MTSEDLAEYARQAKDEAADWQAKDVLRLLAHIRDLEERLRRARVEVMGWEARAKSSLSSRTP
jgi:transposase-like protein